MLERKEQLRALIRKGLNLIRYSEHIRGRGEKLLDTFCAAGLEGVIAKQADGRYVGARSGSWLKTKCLKRQEFVIVGWTPSDKARGFRSLLFGVNDGGTLRYAARSAPASMPPRWSASANG